ncbi:MAG TPA: response regulator [Opitutaceae bacterium]|nr:response regulator [Opitutaceae bacterium]
MAEDDPDDRLLAAEAFAESRLHNGFLTVENGLELLQYLRHEGIYGDVRKYPRPGLILLDLNMPKMDGRQALKEIRSDPMLRTIPVVVMTTSKAQEDIVRSYELGVNSFITKPVSFEGMVTVLKDLGRYWFEIVELPEPPPGA